jgi:glycine cleavage system H lipoate-binding protein
MTGVSKYLNTEAGKINGVKTLNDQELISAVQNDPYAIGFCKMIDITGTDNQQIVENIRLLPLDKNGNGKMDYMERIYDDMDAFSRGIWIGKYPKSLYSDIYLVSKAQPKNENEVAFLTWVLNDGQKFLNPNGYSDLVYNERQMQLDKLVPPVIYANTSNEALSLQTLLLIIFIGILVLGVIVDLIVRYVRNKKAVTRVFPPVTPGYFDENSVVVPKGLFFDKTHTWAFMEKDGVVKIGIDDFLQRTTGPITRIEMKNPGEKIKKGEKVLSIIQKGKQLNIYAPISGTIIEHNNALVINSSIINSSPYADGWVYMIEPANWLREIQFLNMAEKYKNWLVQEFTRLKDFLALSLKMGTPEYSKVIFQDGGVLKESILKDLGPEVWEDFQTKFIDTSR